MSARAPRNNVLAGLFVLLCLGLAVGCIIALSNIGEVVKHKVRYTVRFSLSDGAEGLDKGAAVKVGGKRVGRVTDVHFTPSEGEPEFVDVVIEVDARIKLYADADVQLLKPLLGSGSSINIAAGPDSSPWSKAFAGPPKPLGEGDMILGRLGAPGLIAPSDYARLQSIIARVDEIVGEIQPRLGPIMDDAQTAVADVRSVLGDARGAWPGWRDRVSGVLDRASEEAAALKGIGASISDGVKEVRALIEENRPAIREGIDNARDLIVRLNKEAYDKVMAALEDGRATLETARAAVTRVDRLIEEKAPELTDMVTSAAVAAQQLKLATTEIRASPWRLLYQPTKKELENELLYNSVRQYATSVSELRYAAESLRAVSDRAGASGNATTDSGKPAFSDADRREIDALTAKLRAAFDEYQKQERAFLDRWVKTDK